MKKMTKIEFQKEKKKLSTALDKLTKTDGETTSQAEERKAKRDSILEQHALLREEYLSSNQPCPTGSTVEITDYFNRTLKGIATEFKILEDGDVYITAYKVGSQTKFLTRPHREVKILASAQ